MRITRDHEYTSPPRRLPRRVRRDPCRRRLAPGELDASHTPDGRWCGSVWWTVSVGMRHLDWLDQNRLRAAPSPALDLRQIHAMWPQRPCEPGVGACIAVG